MLSWAKIKGVFILSRRNVARVIAALAAAILAFHTAAAPLSQDDESLYRRTSAAMCRLLPIEDSMPPETARITMNDGMFLEVAELFFKFRHLVPGSRKAAQRGSPGGLAPPAAARIAERPATKADLRAAVKELMGAIERIGGKVDAAKTETIRTMNRTKRDIINGAPSDRINGPRKPKGERNKQIAAVRKAIRESRENGRRLSILQACRKVWQNIKGGYPSVMALYQYCHNHSTEF